MRAIRCAKCGEYVGRLHTPSAADIKESMKGSPYAALSSMIPPNITETLAEMLAFTCPTCTPENSDASTADAGRGENREAE